MGEEKEKFKKFDQATYVFAFSAETNTTLISKRAQNPRLKTYVQKRSIASLLQQRISKECLNCYSTKAVKTVIPSHLYGCVHGNEDIQGL